MVISIHLHNERVRIRLTKMYNNKINQQSRKEFEQT